MVLKSIKESQWKLGKPKSTNDQTVWIESFFLDFHLSGITYAMSIFWSMQGNSICLLYFFHTSVYYPTSFCVISDFFTKSTINRKLIFHTGIRLQWPAFIHILEQISCHHLFASILSKWMINQAKIRFFWQLRPAEGTVWKFKLMPNSIFPRVWITSKINFNSSGVNSKNSLKSWF